MQYRTLGRTGLRVSEIGYGGGRVRPDQDEAETLRVLHRAFELGVNYLDTAPSYGDGRSEEIIGRAIEGRRDGLIVATKTKARRPDTIRQEVEGSLRRLRCDVIDVLQFHGGYWAESETDEVLREGGLDAYERLRDEGKVRVLGFSADGPSTGVSRLLDTGRFDMIQTHYNLMYGSTHDLFGDRGVIPDAEALGMGVVLMRSTTSGVFPRLMRACFPREMNGVDLDGFLLNYVLSNPLVDVALMSMRRVEDAEWTNAVSDDAGARLDLKALHRG